MAGAVTTAASACSTENSTIRFTSDTTPTRRNAGAYRSRTTDSRLAWIPPAGVWFGPRASAAAVSACDCKGLTLPLGRIVASDWRTASCGIASFFCPGDACVAISGVPGRAVWSVSNLGCNAVAVAPDCRDGLNGSLAATELAQISDLDAVICQGGQLAEMRQALAARTGAIVPLLTDDDFAQWLMLERHACIDTTAAGGNVALLGG